MTDRDEQPSAAKAKIELERDVFMRSLVRELAGCLENVVGIDEASGFISVVGQRIAEWIEGAYREELGEEWTRQQVAEVLVDLKRRIQGDFSIESLDESKIVFNNCACPFGDKVIGRESMCMMTSNVFGSISAKHLGYTKVSLDETIARGDGRCRVTLHLKPGHEVQAHQREYFSFDEPSE